MNIQRYLLPASMAAAFHAAVFYGFPSNAGTIRPPILRKLSVDRPPEAPFEMPDPPPAAQPADQPAASPRRGNERPELPPSLPNNELKAGFEMPADTSWKTRTPVEITQIGPPGTPDGTAVDGPAGPGTPTGDIGTLDGVPRTLAQMPPEYPATLRRDRVEGSALVEFVVDISGHVRSAHVVNCSRPEFAAPTVRAVMRWRFEPGRRNGLLVPFRMAVPVNYRLESD